MGDPLGGILTEDQKTELEAIREGFRAEVEALLTAVRNARQAGDEAAAAEAHEALKALHETIRAEIETWMDANLTQDQKDALEAARAEREAEREARQAAERAVMEEVLGITSEQADELLAAVETFREALRALDRSGDIQAAIEALRADLEVAVSAVLTDDASFEIWQIHQVLAHRARRFGGRPAGGGAGG